MENLSSLCGQQPTAPSHPTQWHEGRQISRLGAETWGQGHGGQGLGCPGKQGHIRGPGSEERRAPGRAGADALSARGGLALHLESLASREDFPAGAERSAPRGPRRASVASP